MQEEKKKIDSVILLLRQTIMQTNEVPAAIVDGVMPVEKLSKSTKKHDRRSEVSRARLLKVWELSRAASGPRPELNGHSDHATAPAAA